MYGNYINIFDPNSQYVPLSFCYSMLDSVSAPKFVINGSKWSLFTGKIWTCGHKKVAIGFTLQGGL